MTPTYAALLVRYDPLATDYASLARACAEAARLAKQPGGGERPRPAPGEADDVVSVPVVYGGDWGPDLAEVARHTGLDAALVASRHAAGLYHIYMVGFAPGFAYLGGLDPDLATPRRQAPRPRVPEGSVGIAGEQTGVYPRALPGGWQIIGRTPLALWDPHAAEPALLGPGRTVRFVDAGPGEEGWAEALRLARAEEARQSLEAGRRGGRLPAARRHREALRSPETPLGAEPLAEVVTAGPFDTVQDGGRWGYSGLGLPESGALDWPFLAEANRAAENDPGAAALEAAYGGLRLRFLTVAGLAVSPGTRALLDGSPVEAGRAVRARAGALLELGTGAVPRSYIAFRGGGLACPVVLGSRATYTPVNLGGLDGRHLRAGDILYGFACPSSQDRSTSSGREGGPPSPSHPGPGRGAPAEIVVRAVPGPQSELFADEAVAAFFSRPWRILPASDRRACLLEGQPLEAPAGGSVSDGSPAGSVQVPPDGKPLVLLADHQTTGGYAKIATVVGVDLPLLARAWPESTVAFRAVTPAQARSLWLAMPQAEARGWPGNDGEEERPASSAGRVLLMNLKGRRHLVRIEEPSPPPVDD